MIIKDLILILFMAASANSLCCHWHEVGIKSVCKDGKTVHPWQCCGTGSCNMFCCNCAGHCKGVGEVDWNWYLANSPHEYKIFDVVNGNPKLTPNFVLGHDQNGNALCRMRDNLKCDVVSECDECLGRFIPPTTTTTTTTTTTRTTTSTYDQVKAALALDDHDWRLKIGRYSRWHSRRKRSVMVSGMDDRNSGLMDGLEATIHKFKSLDLDNSGYLDQVEVARIFGALDEDSLDLARQGILELDTNKDGAINPVEFDKDLEGIL